MSSPDDVGMALAARPTLEIVKETELSRARARGVYQGFVSALALMLTALCLVICGAVWFGPGAANSAAESVTDRIVQSGAVAHFVAGFLCAFLVLCYVKLFRWLLGLPWREMWR